MCHIKAYTVKSEWLWVRGLSKGYVVASKIQRASKLPQRLVLKDLGGVSRQGLEKLQKDLGRH